MRAELGAESETLVGIGFPPEELEAHELLFHPLRVAVETAFDYKKLRVAVTTRKYPPVEKDQKKERELAVEADLELQQLKKSEEFWTRRACSLLRKTEIGPWLVEHKTAGLHMARVVAHIEDPLCFPGQRCSEGHYFSPVGLKVGERCQAEDDKGKRCPGIMQEPRPGSGVRSLWHWAGLHVVEGRLPMRRKGKQADWNPKVRTSCLLPDVGIAAQIVRVPGHPYRLVYDEAKERLTRERGAESGCESDADAGSAELRSADGHRGIEGEGGAPLAFSGVEDTAMSEASRGPRAKSGGADVMRATALSPGASAEPQGADRPCESESLAGPLLAPWQIEKRARIIAVKALLGDMLVEWKRLRSA